MNNANANASNAFRLLCAGFFAILAAGVGFSIRAGILSDWASAYGFTSTELGTITGGGLTGFGLIIILSSLFADRIGYGPLMVSAFVMHFLSAVVTLMAGWVFAKHGKEACYWCLYVGMFMFAIGNGVCEAVVNPLVATLYPKNKTHYLNILHAGWPAGLIVGSLASYFIAGKASWQVQMSLFLIPTVLYGALMLGQRFPISEARAAGMTFGEMIKQFAAPLLLLLLVIHALVGYVELGTDSWISTITGKILGDPKQGLLLFVYTSGLMFVLRFFGGPIVHRISPLGLLFVSAICGSIGLTLLGHVQTAKMVVLAATIYGLGKTFLWPTMLAVVSERFPRGGAITIGTIGGVGMLSAGMLGGPGIGYKQDYFASNELKTKNMAVYQEFKADKENGFLIFPKIAGLDGSKVGAVTSKTEATLTPLEQSKKSLLEEASLYGGRRALQVTAAIPATMAVLYLLLLIYFKSKGGYKPVELTAEKRSGGIPAPVR